MSPATETSYSLQEIANLQSGGVGDQGVVISTANLRKLTADIENHPDITLKAERAGRTRYLVRIGLRLTPKRLEKELSTRYV